MMLPQLGASFQRILECRKAKNACRETLTLILPSLKGVLLAEKEFAKTSSLTFLLVRKLAFPHRGCQSDITRPCATLKASMTRPSVGQRVKTAIAAEPVNQDHG